MLALGDFWSSNTIDLYLHRSLTTWINVMRIQDFHALIVDMLLTRCLVGRSNAASNCDAEVARIFHLKITLADETGKMFSLVCRSNCQSCCRYPLSFVSTHIRYAHLHPLMLVLDIHFPWLFEHGTAPAVSLVFHLHKSSLFPGRLKIHTGDDTV
ncbi:hypothetical protein NC653_020910 [Populus alba x Populus x berolinensis]|uniref:Uncharacterized protein n=1 Tax=Populus alba x Populus x berolinensis TaxID=444605 RepID=A0AAD6MP04_9ROSI|nr:hypothetical protein NC653_020910 [Populus alba x Populus x berolinensis]